MKKQITSVKRRKWIVGGLLLFGGVALLVSGFATWLIGINKPNDKDDIGVGVDTVVNKSVSISIELSDNSLYLREKVVKDENDKDQIITSNSEKDADLEITFSKITIKCGLEYYQTNYCVFDETTQSYVPKPFNLSVNFDLDGSYIESLENKDDVIDITKNIIVDNKNNKFPSERLKDDIGNYLNEYTYIDVLDKNLPINQEDIEDNWTTHSKGYKELVITNKVCRFKWGTYFSYRNNENEIINNGPCAFYNHLSKKNGSSWRTIENLQKIQEEIEAMNQSFKVDTPNRRGLIVIEVSLPNENN